MNHAASLPSTRLHELRALLVPFISKRVEPQDVDDVVQTVFVRIQRGLDELRATDRLVAWAYQIARNAIVDHVRRRAVRTHEPLDQARTLAAARDADDDSGAGELALILRHFIAMLPPPYREALQLTELDGMTQAEAARRAGLSLPGMKSRVQRARAQLRDLVEDCCDIQLDTRGGIIDVEPSNPPADLPGCCARSAASLASDVRLPSMPNTRESSKGETNPMPTTDEETGGCCGGPAPVGTAACCVQDAVAKAAGESGCGCEPKPVGAKQGCC